MISVPEALPRTPPAFSPLLLLVLTVTSPSALIPLTDAFSAEPARTPAFIAFELFTLIRDPVILTLLTAAPSASPEKSPRSAASVYLPFNVIPAILWPLPSKLPANMFAEPGVSSPIGFQFETPEISISDPRTIYFPAYVSPSSTVSANWTNLSDELIIYGLSFVPSPCEKGLPGSAFASSRACLTASLTPSELIVAPDTASTSAV